MLFHIICQNTDMGEHHLNVGAETVLELIFKYSSKTVEAYSTSAKKGEFGLEDFYIYVDSLFMFIKESKIYHVDTEDSSLIENNNHRSKGIIALYTALKNYNDQA